MRTLPVLVILLGGPASAAPKSKATVALAVALRPVASAVVTLPTVIKAIEFPKPKGNGVVVVRYPFTFQPAEPPAVKK